MPWIQWWTAGTVWPLLSNVFDNVGPVCYLQYNHKISEQKQIWKISNKPWVECDCSPYNDTLKSSPFGHVGTYRDGEKRVHTENVGGRVRSAAPPDWSTAKASRGSRDAKKPHAAVTKLSLCQQIDVISTFLPHNGYQQAGDTSQATTTTSVLVKWTKLILTKRNYLAQLIISFEKCPKTGGCDASLIVDRVVDTVVTRSASDSHFTQVSSLRKLDIRDWVPYCGGVSGVCEQVPSLIGCRE